MNENLFKIQMQKHIKWVKTLLHHDMNALLNLKVLLSRKQIKRAMYKLIIQQNFSTKLLRLLIQVTLSRDILTMFLYMSIINMHCKSFTYTVLAAVP
jgi:hypothetical protein